MQYSLSLSLGFPPNPKKYQPSKITKGNKPTKRFSKKRPLTYSLSLSLGSPHPQHQNEKVKHPKQFSAGPQYDPSHPNHLSTTIVTVLTLPLRDNTIITTRALVCCQVPSSLATCILPRFSQINHTTAKFALTNKFCLRTAPHPFRHHIKAKNIHPNSTKITRKHVRNIPNLKIYITLENTTPYPGSLGSRQQTTARNCTGIDLRASAKHVYCPDSKESTDFPPRSLSLSDLFVRKIGKYITRPNHPGSKILTNARGSSHRLNSWISNQLHSSQSDSANHNKFTPSAFVRLCDLTILLTEQENGFKAYPQQAYCQSLELACYLGSLTLHKTHNLVKFHLLKAFEYNTSQHWKRPNNHSI